MDSLLDDPTSHRVSVFGADMSVGRQFGSGGEATVYAVSDNDSVDRYALKWFKPRSSTPIKFASVIELLRHGRPSPSFLWPVAAITSEDPNRFGYLMDIRPSSYAEFKDIVYGQRTMGPDQLLRSCFELSLALRGLHLSGLCYRDLNMRNVFVDPSSGQILLCDNDNIALEGTSNSQVRGVPKYMAPEVAQRITLPSLLTDRYSLAVILFQMLMLHHPLVGRRSEGEPIETPEVIDRHFGQEPIFVFHPSDERNHLDPDRFESHVHPQKYWDVYPKFLRGMFTRTFTVGLHEPTQRPTDTQWCDALVRLMAARTSCGACGFFAYEDLPEDEISCARCGASVRSPRIELTAANGSKLHSLVVRPDSYISSHHVNLDFDLRRVIAGFEAGRGGELLLRNLTKANLEGTSRAGRPFHLGPYRATVFEDIDTMVFEDASSGRVVTGRTSRTSTQEGDPQ